MPKVSGELAKMTEMTSDLYLRGKLADKFGDYKLGDVGEYTIKIQLTSQSEHQEDKGKEKNMTFKVLSIGSNKKGMDKDMDDAMDEMDDDTRKRTKKMMGRE